MEVPDWFRNAIQQRLDEIISHSDVGVELQQARAEEQEAFASLYGGMDVIQFTKYMAWEDRHLYRRALENERLYMEGVKDGARLAAALIADGSKPEEDHS
ncbi:hypothetical protein [Cohnella hashimotonis]|uniref:Uncharacterized protein n=1 Tax=Cohnella hashimotonis TaxID=2826895 RepID=A0ABT6TNP6_9BACL|nr:hypothetical protein [Cohnella hashimotonis]MDI4647873.1 hypothetical protein [Cohnella hashimotonis]